jgi:manganese/iron transport system ATP-binding protein/manganese/zinc/iron transport system ATP- binding protein
MHPQPLEVSDLTVSYHRIPVLHHLNLQVGCGNCVALLGPNGAGKTTLLKALAGLLPLETGKIRFHGRDWRDTSTEFAYLPQRESIDWDFPITVRGVVEMGRYSRLGWWRRFLKEDAAVAQAAITAMHLDAFADRQISALSGGQQQRVFLARSLAQEAHVLLLDEPFNGLDKPTQENLGRIIRSLADEGRLIIASHHDIKSVPELFDQVIFLNGELIANGPTADIFTPENIARTFGTEVFAGGHHALAR